MGEIDPTSSLVPTSSHLVPDEAANAPISTSSLVPPLGGRGRVRSRDPETNPKTGQTSSLVPSANPQCLRCHSSGWILDYRDHAERCPDCRPRLRLVGRKDLE